MRFLGPELSDAECRRESRQALTGSTTLRCEGEDYSEFLLCKMTTVKASVESKVRSVGKEDR